VSPKLQPVNEQLVDLNETQAAKRAVQEEVDSGLVPRQDRNDVESHRTWVPRHNGGGMKAPAAGSLMHSSGDSDIGTTYVSHPLAKHHPNLGQQ